MTTQYTPILKLALPVQGELSGTWGDVVNDNITSMVEQAIAGRSVIDTWSANSHVLTTANGTTAESRAAMLSLTDSGTALTGAGSVICPALSKVYIVKNGTAQVITVKTAAGSGIAVPVGKTMLVYCDGTDVLEAVDHVVTLSAGTLTITGLTTFASLKGTGAVTVTDILDEDNMASDSATALVTQQSVKAYVASQVGANNELSEVLANGNTTGANDIDVDAAQKVQFRDAAIYINSSVDGQLDIVADTEIQIDTTTVDINGAVDVSGTLGVTGAATFSGNVGVGSSDFGSGGTINLSVGVAGVTAGGLQLWASPSETHYMQFGDSTAGGAPYSGAVGYNHGTDSLLFLTAGSSKLTIDSAGAATFSSTVRSTGYSLTAATGQYYHFDATTGNNFMGLYGANTLGFYAGGVLALTLGPTAGAATFSGEITTTSGPINVVPATTTTYAHTLYQNASGLMYVGRDSSAGSSLLAGSSAYAGVINVTGAYPIEFGTNNVKRMTLDASGNLGVGTSSPTSPLHIKSATDVNVRFDDSGGSSYTWYMNDAQNIYIPNVQLASTHTFYANGQRKVDINASGNLGVGTSSPLGKVTIAYSAGANAPSTVTAANTYLQLGSDDYGPSNNGKFMIGFGFTDATNTNSPAYIGYEEVSTSGDTYGDLTFYTRSVTTDTAPTERLRIAADGKIQIGSNIPIWSGSYGGALFLKGNNATGDRYAQLAIVDSAGSIAQQGLIIDNSGNLGLGTSSPSAGIPLTAYYSPTSQMHLGGAGNIVSNNTYFNGTAWVNRNSAVGGAVLQLSTDGSFAFRRAGTGANPTLNYSALIDASGNLGLGTTSPVSFGANTSFFTANGTSSGNGYACQVAGTNYGFMYASTNLLTIAAEGASTPIAFATNNATRMVLDTNGNLGLRKTPSAAWTADSAIEFNSVSTGYDGSVANYGGVHAIGQNYYYDGNYKYLEAGYASRFYQYQSDFGWQNAGYAAGGSSITWNTAMKLDASGNLSVGTSISGFGFSVYKVASDVINSFSGTAPNSSRSLYTGFHSASSSTAGTLSFNVTTNGNVTNTNGSYGTISDIKLKENVVDVSPKLNDLMQVRVVNYNLKESLGYAPTKQIGFIAQELEQVFPAMISEMPDRDEEGNDLGTFTKSVKSSVFVPMLIKAIQEQQAIIEALTARIEALEGA